MTLVDRPVREPAIGSVVPAPGRGQESLVERPRRLRRSPELRGLVRETLLHPSRLIQPLFVVPGAGRRDPIEAMPGQARISPDVALDVARELAGLGVGGVILFGIPDAKDPLGDAAADPAGPVPETLRRLRAAGLGLVLAADVCLCEYTTHGHCGILDGERIDNDATLPALAAASVAYAEAGADIVAPSAMMDGQVAAIRAGLDRNGFEQTSIMAYAAKAASAFYGPFRDAAGSSPAFGDRRGYQMDPANGHEAMREIELDVREGADIVLVKPALPNLDQVAAARARWDVPIAAYQVSGEYAMIAAAADRGWLDRERATIESITAIVRAGAGIVITYAAADMAGWLGGES